MPDEIFENPRLTQIYDVFDGERTDLVHYLAIARELKAQTILDIGCGTGSFSDLLASKGFDVTGLEPANASLEMAKLKPFASKINWVLGDMLKISDLHVDLAVMTGNVAQVFVTDAEWVQTLEAIHRVLHDKGYFVFEVRDPSKKVWLEWAKENTYQRLNVPEVGYVEGWCDVQDVSGDLVTFVWTYHFEEDGASISSESTLRFREKEDIESSLLKTGFSIKDIRDAPDRPGKEFVFIAQRDKT